MPTAQENRSPRLPTHYRIGRWTLVRAILSAVVRFVGAFVLLTLLQDAFSGPLRDATVRLITALGIVFTWLGTRIWIARALHRKAMRLMREEQYLKAGAVLDHLCANAPTLPLHASFVFNRAAVYTLMEQFEAAQALHKVLLECLDSYPTLLRRAPVASIKASAATFYAWANDLETATRLLQETEKTAESAHARQWANIVISLRQGAHRDVLPTIDNLLTSDRSVNDPLELSTLQVLKAFSLSRTDAGIDTAEPPHFLSAEALRRAKWIGCQWPELADFISKRRSRS